MAKETRVYLLVSPTGSQTLNEAIPEVRATTEALPGFSESAQWWDERLRTIRDSIAIPAKPPLMEADPLTKIHATPQYQALSGRLQLDRLVNKSRDSTASQTRRFVLGLTWH